MARAPRNLFENNNQSPAPKRAARNLFENSDPDSNEGFFQKLPRNVGTGLANMGHTLLNTPHDIAKGVEYLEDKLSPKSWNIDKNRDKLSNYIPFQEEKNFAKMLGQKGKPTFADTLVQKGTEFAPEILTGANALRNVIPHLTKRGAVKTLNKARDLAKGREIGTLNVNPELIEDARQYLPNNLPERNLLGASQSGDYDSLFKLQSDLGKVSSKRMGKVRSLFSPESQITGEAGLSSRNRLLDAIHENLQSQGHHDISQLLKQGQKEYRRYSKFKPYRNALAMAGALYATPKNALTDLVKKMISIKGQ